MSDIPLRILLGMEWQQLSENDWVFGVKERGIVRDYLANVRFSDKDGWTWLVQGMGARERGGNLSEAIRAAEKALGILSSQKKVGEVGQ